MIATDPTTVSLPTGLRHLLKLQFGANYWKQPLSHFFLTCGLWCVRFSVCACRHVFVIWVELCGSKLSSSERDSFIFFKFEKRCQNLWSITLRMSVYSHYSILLRSNRAFRCCCCVYWFIGMALPQQMEWNLNKFLINFTCATCSLISI